MAGLGAQLPLFFDVGDIGGYAHGDGVHSHDGLGNVASKVVGFG